MESYKMCKSGTRKSSLAVQEGQKEKTEHAFRGGWLPCSLWNLKSGWKGLLQILGEILQYVAWRGLLVTCYTSRKHPGPS